MASQTSTSPVGEKASTFFWTYLRPNFHLVLLLIFCYFLVSLLTAAQPLVMAPMLDIVLGNLSMENTPAQPEALGSLDLNNIGAYLLSILAGFELSQWQTVWAMAIAYLVISILLYLLNFGVYLLALWIRINSEREIQKDLFAHVISLSLDFFHRKRTGELISRLDQDTRATVSGLANIARSVVVSSFLALFYSALLVRTNVRLTLFIILAGALHYGLTQLIRNPIKQRVRDQFNIMADNTAYIQEVISSIRVVKSFVAEAYERMRLSNIIERLRLINLRYGVFKHVDEPVGQIINAISNVAILLLATQELFQGTLTPTGFFLYLYVGRAVLDPITDLARTYTALQTTFATSERVRDLFSEQPSIRGGEIAVQQLKQDIRFSDVAFSYADSPVLTNVDIQIRKGQITALVGPSGAGKSTLFDLLLRFYDPQEGRILVDGKDLRELDLSEYRRLFGVVSQESLLFNASVFDNIAYPGLDVSLANVREAAQIANADEFIERMPQGYNSLIGDRGVLVSGGQRQRLAIARAVVRKPQILLLDEATSSLDSESEKLVQDAIDRVIRGTTAVIIAHRLSTVIHADQIVVLDQGRVVDQGKHTELLARCDLYRSLCELQFDLKTD
ncbi:MAG: ABC transporter ATP-binding protein [Anaerolineales bacterium]|nr:ABC transporter ATP-binding protein [Anaerolineales bacterium]MCW5855420.1 ABC transporter ATP-binding protein [Anaerolineales bacterium]